MIAVIFISLAGYVWLNSLYDGVIAGLRVGGIHFAITMAVIARSFAVRSRNRRLAQAQIDLAAKQPGWRIDPGYVAMGVKIVKIIGVRNLVPPAAAGLLAAGWSANRGKLTARPPH